MLDMTVDDLWKKLKTISTEDDTDIPQWLAFTALAAFFFIYWYVGQRHFIFAGASYGADNSSHLAEITKVAAMMREGQFNAFWFPQSNLGYPLFTGYNALPYLIMGALVAVTQTFWQPMHVYNTSIILLHAIVPLCWYACGRLLRLPRLTSLCFALMPVFMVEYTMFGLHANTTMGMGLYTQLWALPLFPLVFACYYRLLVLETRGSMLTTVLAHSLLCSIHNLLGFFAGLGGLLFLVLRRKCWRKYFISQGIIFLLFSYWIVAWLNNHTYLVKIAFIDHPIYGDGFLKTITYLVEGKFFDFQRPFPIMTLLLAIGALVILRTQTLLRAWAVCFFLFGLIMLLYAPGDSLLGHVIPFFQEIPYRRYTAIMQLGGALIIAWGASYLLLKAARLLAFVLNINHTAIVRDLVIIAAILLSLQHLILARKTFRTLTINPDFAATSEFLQNEQHARFLVHSQFGTNSHFFRNFLPLLSDRSQLTSYARGIRDTLSSYYTTVFDFAPLSYELFNVRYLVSNNKEISPHMRNGFSLKQRFGGIHIYGSDNEYGYFDVIQSNFAVTAFTSEAAVEYLRKYTRRFYYYRMLPRLTHTPPDDVPFVAFADGKPLYYLQADSEAIDAEQFNTKLISNAQHYTTKIKEKVSDNSYQAELELDTPAYLLLKASYHPGWQATVNGEPTAVHAIAPNLMAVSLPAGQHEVIYYYRNDLLTQVLFLLCAIAWLALLGFAIYTRQFSKNR